MNARERTYATPLVAIRANATIAPTVSSGPVVGSFSASVVVSEFALDEGVSVVEGVSAWFDVSLSAESSLEDDVSLGSRVYLGNLRTPNFPELSLAASDHSLQRAARHTKRLAR